MKEKMIVLLYYIILSLLFNKLLYALGTNFIFQCTINSPKDMDCLDIVVNSTLFGYIGVILFLIIDIGLLKSYKHILKKFI